MASSGWVDDTISVPGEYLSGLGQFYSNYVYGYVHPTCDYCKKRLGASRVEVNRHGHMYTCCLDCAGFKCTKKMSPRESVIRVMCPLDPKTPRAILADWLEENGKQDDADYLRRMEKVNG